jgi:hypothetical protein
MIYALYFLFTGLMSTCLLALVLCRRYLYVCTDVMTHFAFVVIHVSLLLFSFSFLSFFLCLSLAAFTCCLFFFVVIIL